MAINWVKSNKNSLRALCAEVSSEISLGYLENGLKLIHDFVEKVITEPLCTGEAFGSRLLDQLCLEIGTANWGLISSQLNLQLQAKCKKDTYIYIVTKLQSSGGHTRVIEDFILARPDSCHVVLSTELNGKSDRYYFENKFDKKLDVRFEYSSRGTYLEKLTWLQKRLFQIGAERIYLFNHHQDSVAVAAVVPDLVGNLSFYHHGDHHLCLGVYLGRGEHIDPHPFGYQNCRENFGIDNTYVPLVIDDKGIRPDDLQFMESGNLTTCTAARSNKLEIPYFISYLEVIPELLRATGGRHIHIGKLSPWGLMKIKRQLKKYGIATERFTYIPWVPSVWRALHELRIDLYISSFPYIGGLTLLEAMGAGTPVVMHNHIASRLLSGVDMAHPEVFFWRDPNELFDYCKNLSASELIRLSKIGRQHFEDYHSRELLVKFLDKKNLQFCRIDSQRKYFKQQDEWVFFLEQQISFGHLFGRELYRLFRKLRSRLN